MVEELGCTCPEVPGQRHRMLVPVRAEDSVGVECEAQRVIGEGQTRLEELSRGSSQ